MCTHAAGHVLPAMSLTESFHLSVNMPSQLYVAYSGG